MNCGFSVYIVVLAAFLMGCVDHQEAGIEEFDKGNYEKAIYHFEKDLKMEPDHEYNLYSLGRSYYQIKEYEQAIETFTKSLAIDDENTFVNLARAKVYFEMEEWDLANRDATTYLHTKKNDTDALILRARARLKMLKNGSAYEDLQKVLSIDDQNKMAWYYMAIAVSYGQDFRRAIDLFYKCLDLDPDFNQVYYNIGILYQRQRKWYNAIESYSAAANKGFKPNDIYTRRAFCYTETGQIALACDDINKIPDDGVRSKMKKDFCL